METEPNRSEVVTSFLVRKRADGSDELLLLHRSERVGTYRGCWAAVSGHLEGEPLAHALTEIREETGFGEDEVRLLQRGEPFSLDDDERDLHWLIYTFLFEVTAQREPMLDWEHTESRWIRPDDISQFDTVPLLREAFVRLYSLESSAHTEDAGEADRKGRRK